MSGIRLKELEKYIVSNSAWIAKFKSILLLCGTNNVTKDPVPNILSLFLDVIRRIKSINPLCKILVSAILPRPRDDAQYSSKVKEINFQLRKECLKLEVHYISSNRLFIKSGVPVSNYFYDGLHLKPEGVKRLRQFFSQKLAEFGTKPVHDMSYSRYYRRDSWLKTITSE
jgi:lysophospholipase L1-like esterase